MKESEREWDEGGRERGSGSGTAPLVWCASGCRKYHVPPRICGGVAHDTRTKPSQRRNLRTACRLDAITALSCAVLCDEGGQSTFAVLQNAVLTLLDLDETMQTQQSHQC